METSCKRVRQRLERAVGERDGLLRQLSAAEMEEANYTRAVKNAELARGIIQEVAQKTQQQLEYRVGELVTLALAAVFPDPYEMRLQFDPARGRTQARIILKRGELEVDPMDEAGGGVVDVTAFALRVALWSMRRPRNRAVLLLDEPFKFVSEDLQPAASRLLKEVCERLGLQIIMVTHSETLIEAADKVFRVRMNSKGRSEVTTG